MLSKNPQPLKQFVNYTRLNKFSHSDFTNKEVGRRTGMELLFLPLNKGL